MTSGTNDARPAEVAPPAARLGPIEVRTDTARVLDFQHACGGEPVPGIVPLVFPIRWLAMPEIRARLVEAAGNELVPVHESQSFAYERRLALESDYRLAVELTRTSEPERLTLQGTVSTPEGNVCVRFETVLRLVGLEGRASGSPR